MDYTTVRSVLDEVGVPECWPAESPESKILRLMKVGEKYTAFGSPFRSRVLHDGKFRQTCRRTDEFVEYKIVGASYVVEFGYGIRGVELVCVYPHCDLTKLRSVLEPLVKQWQQELEDAKVFNAVINTLSATEKSEYFALRQPTDRKEYLCQKYNLRQGEKHENS